MLNVEQTIISQFANSVALVQLVKDMNDCIDPSADIQAFYDYCWNVDTAQSWGLDIWGKIVGVGRNIQVAGTIDNFGFKEGLNYEPFGQAPFYTGTPATSTYTLADPAYRTLIYVKALSNISDSTARTYNRLLQNLFAGRGRCYVQETGQMQMRYVFEFALLPYEISIITGSGAFPHPAGVDTRSISLDPSSVFGFQESRTFQPFGQGTLFPTSGLLHVV